ncbi:MAG: AMP-dependent synthetase and ligase [Candidatus Magnetoglobus multicellularis str. Araruama]|uniref:AMP-dependent synthetase and ligase n=1 Tax=Candidatus Magnetoglobus multicellularis str. Araruama TaxID=890399 RepID=A0A1V1PI05_9BACT|nr:MAG: AMP-dependent synthetase and ligase [Candidatus Magnetoglobus multicellularis str. Araruama]
MQITEILSRNARLFGKEIALIERDPEKNCRDEIDWNTFDTHSNQLASFLISKDVHKGDRIVQLMTNCIEWLPVYFGILRTNALAVPLNYRFLEDNILKCTETAEAKVFIFGKAFIERVNIIKPALDSLIKFYIYVGDAHDCPDYAILYNNIIQSQDVLYTQLNDIKIEITDPAALYFTSGTTGTPKATLLSHRNLEFACYVENQHHQQTHQDNFLCIPPLYHTGAKMHWFGNFIVGAKAVILKGTRPQWILEAISEESVTVVWLLVPWALDILFAIECGDLKLHHYDLSQWRLMHIGAQPVPPSLIHEWKKVFPHHQYDTNYGLTEATGPGCIHLGMDNMHKVGAIGIPGFDWETQIIDESGHTVEPEQPGELAVKGPGIMKEYYKNPEATREVLKNGWLLTGDIARQDNDGFIWLIDRKKDVIISGGENIYPVEIEDFLQQHPSIQDVAVIGLPSPRLGEITAAVIQTKPGKTVTREAVVAFCELLPRYKRPRKIIFDSIPRNPTGKIEKTLLRKKYSGRTESFSL